MPTIARVLEIAPVGCYLAANYREKGKLFNYGRPSSINQSHLIYAIYKVLNTAYTNDPTRDGLQEVSDYLYELLQKFAFRAAQIVDGGGGGQVTPITPEGANTMPNPLDFIVNSTDTPILAGESSIFIPQFVGWDIGFNRGGQPQYTTNPGDGTTYYYWNKLTGLFTMYTAANLGEQLRIFPIGGFATTDNTLADQRQPIFVIVGTSPTAPTAGTSVWANDNFANAYVQLFLNGVPVATADPSTGAPYTTKSFNSNEITITNYTWQANDELLALIITP